MVFFTHQSGKGAMCLMASRKKIMVPETAIRDISTQYGDCGTILPGEEKNLTSVKNSEEPD
jgi:hypothetical protein